VTTPADPLLHELRERGKELAGLHRTAALLQDDLRPPHELLQELVTLLPAAWQYPEITEARICLDDLVLTTPGFRETPWLQSASFVTRRGTRGSVTVCYLEERPAAAEGPFLAEERQLIASVAEMVRAHLQHRQAFEALERAHDELERQVEARTAELQAANAALQERIRQHEQAEARVRLHRAQLRRLASELCLAGERERRAIATDLHDHIGQALAFTKMRVLQFAQNAVFCGFEHDIERIVGLLDGILQFTRTLTCEISPPILYELGLAAGLEWLVEQFHKKHGLDAHWEERGAQPRRLDDELRTMVFQSARELLVNAVKHAPGARTRVRLEWGPAELVLTVEDDGPGFDPATLEPSVSQAGGFGLFSIRERMQHLGGSLTLRSAPGAGCTARLVAPVREKDDGGTDSPGR